MKLESGAGPEQPRHQHLLLTGTGSETPAAASHLHPLSIANAQAQGRLNQHPRSVFVTGIHVEAHGASNLSSVASFRITSQVQKALSHALVARSLSWLWENELPQQVPQWRNVQEDPKY